MTPTGVAEPPDPFDAETSNVPAGAQLYRVFRPLPTTPITVTTFNPGFGGSTRFAFFGDPPVPVLYSAQTDEAAVAESLLHEIPLDGGVLTADEYKGRVMGRFIVQRELQLAKLHGLGLARVRALNTQVIDIHGPGVYEDTVKWAQAAFDAGFDGIEWMSRRCNNARAQVLFASPDHVTATDLMEDATFGRVFETVPGFNWLVDLCAPLRIDVMPPA